MFFFWEGERLVTHLGMYRIRERTKRKTTNFGVGGDVFFDRMGGSFGNTFAGRD